MFVECMYNIAEDLGGWAEDTFGEKAPYAKIEPHIGLIYRDNLTKLLGEARRAGITTAKLVYGKFEPSTQEFCVVDYYEKEVQM